ncbi:MAG TPA: nuclear transport factor 2 family protein [Thermoanaerobaculia bacterium]|nr:nuclear transport factor 2 family protein [Thermoanaerobaculia bacterium]
MATDANKELAAELFARISANDIPGALDTLAVKGLLAEGDKVAVEVEGHGTLRDGRRYDQEYHFVMTLRDGKIAAVREYLDTQQVYATWFAAKSR